MLSTQKITRKTKETEISILLDMSASGEPEIDTELPFFDHILHSMAFHGGFSLKITARGDIDVDPHHLVEDTGLVLGDALLSTIEDTQSIARYGNGIIPMDEALSEVTIDACGRPYLVYRAEYPQDRSGSFDMWLIREFLLALSNRARINIHAHCRYGDNSHHMAESLFKALGISLKQSYSPRSDRLRSTKGVLHNDAAKHG